MDKGPERFLVHYSKARAELAEATRLDEVKVIRNKEGMGMGDVKLVAMLAAFLGYPAIPFIFFAASIQGLIFTLLVLPRVRRHGFMIPFGPFLALAALEWFFFSDRIIEIFIAMYS